VESKGDVSKCDLDHAKDQQSAEFYNGMVIPEPWKSTRHIIRKGEVDTKKRKENTNLQKTDQFWKTAKEKAVTNTNPWRWITEWTPRIF
jgi:hypothetical protein